jgi:hypothetical protein
LGAKLHGSFRTGLDAGGTVGANSNPALNGVEAGEGRTMKTVVAVFRPRIGEGRKRPAPGAERLAIKPVQELDAASRHIRFGFMTSIWCGAMVGWIGAEVIAPFPA